jgi:putative ABC transport system permease protein
MGALRQVAAVTEVSLLGIPQRLGPCSVIVISMAGVVAVLVSVFAMAQGFAEMAAKTGRLDRAIVLGKGVDAEAGSSLAREAIAIILNRLEIRASPAGIPIASAESLGLFRLTDRRTGLDVFATLRGVGPQVLLLRPEIKLVEGRPFKAGMRELIVGRTLQTRLEGLSVGGRLSLPNGEWMIVGAFETGGDSHESELLADGEELLSAYGRNVFSSLTVQVDLGSFDNFKAALLTNPALSVDVKRERDYFTEASRPTTQLLRVVAEFIGGIMALGAVFAAMNAMSSAISARSIEIATLRAIGYRGIAVMVSVFIEVLLFALLGSGIGATAAWYFFSGHITSTLSGTSPASLAYVLNVTPGLMGLGAACSSVIGIVGGLIPAISIARAPVVTAFRPT